MNTRRGYNVFLIWVYILQYWSTGTPNLYINNTDISCRNASQSTATETYTFNPMNAIMALEVTFEPIVIFHICDLKICHIIKYYIANIQSLT